MTGVQTCALPICFPVTIISAMKKNNLQRYLHMSALGADIAGCSMYQRSKGAGEELVKNSSLNWTLTP